MTNEYGNELLHKVLLSTMKDIDKICREHGLRYYLYAGTLLGAMNHGGFIPWDDDVDIVMFPEDFEKLSEIIINDYADRYTIRTLKNDPRWYSSVNKICVNGTSLFFEHDSRKSPFFIDVCVLHSVPDSRWQRFWQRKQLELIELVWGVQSGMIIPTSLISRMSIGLMAKIDRSVWVRYFNRVATKYDRHNTKYVATMFCVLVKNPYNGQKGYEKDITPRCWHEKPLDIMFEDSVFMTLADPVADLNARYPNWQKPFAKEKRMTKHDVKSYEVSPEVLQRLGL